MAYNILVVDDDPINRAVLEEIFSAPHYAVRSACDGAEALAEVEQQAPDIILLDVMMPEMDGFEACTRLKENPATSDIPVLFLTANTDLANKLKGFSCGGADYIVKPFDAQEVLARVRTQLKLREAQALVRRHNEELESMLEERTRELITSERRAAFSLLIEGIIHNLRGPLTAILGLADCVEQECAKGRAKLGGKEGVSPHLANIKNDASIISVAAHEMNDMVNSLMTKSRADRVVQAEVTDLNDVVRAELLFLNGNMRFKHRVKKDIRLLTRPLPIRVVRSELSQVMSNLINNALDATHGQARGHVLIETGRDDAAQAVFFSVSDSGPGVSPDLCDKIFDPFFTTKSRGDQVEGDEPTGTGLGLYTVLRTVESFRGSVEVGTAELGGARFTVRLPLFNKAEKAEKACNERLCQAHFASNTTGKWGLTMKTDEGVMIPDLQSSLICDDVRQERNGKFMLIGLFDAIGVPELPLRYPRLFAVTRWCSGEGNFIQHTRILKPDQSTVLIEGKDIPVKLPGPEASATNVEMFVNINFEQEGTHWMEILLDGDLKIRYPLRVNRVQPSANQPPQGF